MAPSAEGARYAFGTIYPTDTICLRRDIFRCAKCYGEFPLCGNYHINLPAQLTPCGLDSFVQFYNAILTLRKNVEAIIDQGRSHDVYMRFI